MARWVDRGIGLLLAVAVACLPGVGQAVTVVGLYQGVVATANREPGSDALAADALRQVVVRVTGRQAAATDPKLAPVYAQASHYARTFRATASGQTTVDFEGASIDLALARAGQALWGPDRPLTWVLVLARAADGSLGVSAPEPEVRRAMEEVALQRGTPLTWASPLLPPEVLEAAVAGRLAPLLAAMGVEAVLVGVATSGSWRWLGPAGSDAVNGSAVEALAVMADRYGARFAVLGGNARGQLIELRGIRSLTDYVQAQATLSADTALRGVQVESVASDTVRFRVTSAADRLASLQAMGFAGWRPLESVDGVLRFEKTP
jgi:Uncharacterized protein conserved in bacteria (DUF2066)